MPDIFLAKTKKETVQKKASPPVKGSPTKWGENSPILDLGKHLTNEVYILSSFAQNPEDISFKNQERDEKILLFVRKHFVTNWKWITIAVILFFAPLIFLLFNLNLLIFPPIYFLFFILFYYLLLATYIFVNFITWFFNVSFVTNIRVVDVDFSGIIYKNVAATKINQMQDVNFDQTGVLATFFNYGDVLVQTAGEQKNFDFIAVPRPGDIVHIITGLIGKHGNI